MQRKSLLSRQALDYSLLWVSVWQQAIVEGTGVLYTMYQHGPDVTRISTMSWFGYLSGGACSGGAGIADTAIAGVRLLCTPATWPGGMLLPPALCGDR